MRKLITALLLASVAGHAAAATVTLTWTPPTTRVDGSALPAAQIGHADIYDSFGCTTSVPCPNPAGQVIGNVQGAVGTFKTQPLAAGAHTFTVFTIDTGVPPQLSPASNTFSATIIIPGPGAITNLSGVIGP